MDKRVLYAVLNWGLGHATRSVPIIESVLHFGAEVEITSSGAALSFLKKRFPSLRFHKLPDREVRYSKSGARWGLIKRALEQPKINSNQNDFIRKLVDERAITHIVSDNVYGAFDGRIPSALITHQLSLKLPFGESRINGKLASWINQFTEVWIPDGADLLVSGDLASNQKVTIPKKYLGIPSRFSWQNNGEKTYRIGVILGGPEPQRSVLEKRLLGILASVEGKKVVFRGSDHVEEIDQDGIEFHSLGDGEEMATALSTCELVIGRSGYSTLCDLLAIGSKALLIPTRGQTEQEYLALRMSEFPQFSTCTQDKLDVEVILSALRKTESTAQSTEPFEIESGIVSGFLRL